MYAVKNSKNFINKMNKDIYVQNNHDNVFSSRLGKFLLYILKIIFPKYSAEFCCSVIFVKLINKYKNELVLGRLTYKLEKIPNALYETLTNKELIKSDHYIFINEEIFNSLLSNKQECWLNLQFQSPFSNVSNSNYLAVESENDYLNDDNVIDFLHTSYQVIPVPLKNNKFNKVFVKETFYSNIVEKYNLNFDHNIYIRLHQLSYEQSLPQIATSAKIYFVNLPYELPSAITDEIVSNYFEVPHLIVTNHTYEITLKENLIGRNNLAKNYFIFSQLKNIYFRCTNLESKKNLYETQAIISKSLTSLQQSPSANNFRPRRTLHHVSFTYGYPGGLEKYVEELKKSIKPFVINKNRSSNSLFEKCIYPLFLLQGNAGCGKSTMINYVADYYGLHLYKIDCSEIISQIATQTETKLKTAFAKANICKPIILCFKNFELFGVDNEGREDLRLIATLQSELFQIFSKKNEYPVIIIGLTNKDINPLIQRQFLEVIKVDEPSKEERFLILQWLFNTEMIAKENIIKAGDNEIARHELFNCCKCNEYKTLIGAISEKTQGFMYGDLRLLFNNSVKEMMLKQETELSLKHFDVVLDCMQLLFADSVGAPKVPKVLWSDIGGLAKIKDEIQSSIGLPLKHMHLMGKNMRRSGILLYGPPGTGKTLVAKAVATESNLNFLSVQGPELLNMYVGQSEQNVRELFCRARSAAPCVIFLDELDSLAPNRGIAGDSGGVMDRVVSQLLAEMDGMLSSVDVQKQIFILAATNRPDLIDPALLRPGRFDKLFYVGPCSNKEEKVSVLNAITTKFNMDKNLSTDSICDNLVNDMTGADLYAVCSNAWLSAVRRTINTHKNNSSDANILDNLNIIIKMEDFKNSITKFIPSVSEKDLVYFSKLKNNFS